MTDHVEKAGIIWDEIGDDAYQAIMVTKHLIMACLAKCDPSDQQQVLNALFFNATLQEPAGAIH